MVPISDIFHTAPATHGVEPLQKEQTEMVSVLFQGLTEKCCITLSTFLCSWNRKIKGKLFYRCPSVCLCPKLNVKTLKHFPVTSKLIQLQGLCLV